MRFNVVIFSNTRNELPKKYELPKRYDFIFPLLKLRHLVLTDFSYYYAVLSQKKINVVFKEIVSAERQ